MATRIVKRRARVDARFVNNAMMATLMGAAISDGLENGQVVSGVGGQYNFVAQAFALPGARSILTRRGDAAGRRQGAIQHPLELWPRDHSAASARYRRHRIRRRRSQGKIRRRRDRGDAAGRGFAAFRTNWRGRPRMPASCRRILKFRPRYRENLSGADCGRAEAGARGRPAAVVSVRQRFHRRRAAADPGVANPAGRAAFAAAPARTVVAGIDDSPMRDANAWRGSASTAGDWSNAPTARWSARRWRGAGQVVPRTGLIAGAGAAARAAPRGSLRSMSHGHRPLRATSSQRMTPTCSCSPACASR